MQEIIMTHGLKTSGFHEDHMKENLTEIVIGNDNPNSNILHSWERYVEDDNTIIFKQLF